MTVPTLAIDCASSATRHQNLINASLQVQAGKIIGLIGNENSGKTTLLAMAAGLLKPDSGKILLCGKPIEENRSLVGVAMNPPGYISSLTVRENLIASALRKSTADPEQRCLTLIDELGLGEYKNKPVSRCPVGILPFIGLSIALTGRPKLLILDEPFQNLDSKKTICMENVLRNLAHYKKIAILVSAKRISDLANSADELAFFNHGTLSKTYPTDPRQSPLPTSITFSTSNNDIALARLEYLLPSSSFKLKENNEIEANNVEIRQLAEALHETKLVITKLVETKQGLDDYLLKRLKGERW